MSFFEKLFGSFSDKELKRINPLKDKVLALEPEMQKLTDEQLQAKTTEFKARLEKGETLDDLLPEAFATCREACARVLGMRPYETLDKIADYGQTIMTHLTMDHAVHYFDPHVMKGAFVSIGFGVLIYFLLVRKAFMKKNGDGVMEYVYRWPQWLDLEYLVYRPFLYIIIPHICGRLCYMLDQPLIMRALRKLKVESRWMKNREKKKEEKKKENWKKTTKKRMKDSNKYR